LITDYVVCSTESYVVSDTVFYHEPKTEIDICDSVISHIHMPPKCI